MHWTLFLLKCYKVLDKTDILHLQLDQDFCKAIRSLLSNFAVLLGKFKFQTIIWPKMITKIPKLSLNTKFNKICDLWNFLALDSLEKSTYMNIACKHFLADLQNVIQLYWRSDLHWRPLWVVLFKLGCTQSQC